MPNERVIEIPWALSQLPQSGRILDVGSCDANYLHIIQQPDRSLDCLDPRPCTDTRIPNGAGFFQQSIIGNTLPRQYYDAILLLSVIEHIGLPTYGVQPFENGDHAAVAECWSLLKPGGMLVVTMPAGAAKVTTWYRQYTPAMIDALFVGWNFQVRYWGFTGTKYVSIRAEEVEQYDYRDYLGKGHLGGASALAGVTAYRSF